jgi:DNA helicase HerA-like ATPase
MYIYIFIFLYLSYTNKKEKMFSFDEGRKIAVIKGGARDGQYLYMRESAMGLKEVKMGKDEKLQPVPDREIVEKIYISAPSGAGKSTFVGNWLREFKKIFKKDEIYLFSSVDEDKALDRQDPTRIILDDDLLDDPIDIKELSQSLVVLDDSIP